jgi:hypothetical protein
MLGAKSYFIQNDRFKLKDHITLRNVGFDEYLDISSGRKFKEINQAIAEKYAYINIDTVQLDTNVLGDRYFRLVDSVVFEKEFFSDLKKYI